MKKLTGVIIAILLVGGGIAIGYSLQKQKASVGLACTMEAKLCPDGKTYVGRSGPSCEFAACPSSSTSKDYSKSTATQTDVGTVNAYFRSATQSGLCATVEFDPIEILQGELATTVAMR